MRGGHEEALASQAFARFADRMNADPAVRKVLDAEERAVELAA